MLIKEKIKDVVRPIYRAWLAYRHKGSNVCCNICGSSFRELRPVLGRHADGSTFIIKDRVGVCWRCYSYPRMRQLWYWLENDFKISEKVFDSILHVAPELPISDRIRAIPVKNYTCIDKHCKGYKYPAYVQDGDLCALQFKDESFDLILCNHVLEHIKDEKRALSEIYRVLKPGGTAILMVPMDSTIKTTVEEPAGVTMSPEEREKRFGQHDHVRLYGTDY